MAQIPPLFDHQVKSVRFMQPRNCIFDTSDPGTGKTRVQIELFSIRNKKTKKAALVLAPKSLLRSAWEDDFNKFAPHIRTSVATATNREKAFAVQADVYITNIDATVWLAKQPKKFFDRFDTLIIDEASAFKHRTSGRSKALNKIKKYFQFRNALTGTPASNTITDIWHQVFVLDDGQRLGKSFFQFRGAVCHPKQVGPSPNMVEWTDRPGAELSVGSLIADIVVRHKFEDCIDIPPNVMNIVRYHMSPKQTKVYKQMEDQAITLLDSGRIISAVNAAGVTGKLLQIASGASYSEEGTGYTPLQALAADKMGFVPIDSGRYELVADLVEERDNVVCFFHWHHQKAMLLQEFAKRGITVVVIDGKTTDKDRKLAVDHFQAGFYKVLLAHPQSAAHGLTLTRGTATIWASPTYNLEHFIQGNRRIYRAGQKERTETIVITAADTLEDKVMEKLGNKDAKQGSMLDLLKDAFA